MPLTTGKTFTERLLGTDKTTDAQLEEHIKSEAWCHHVSCTCPVGAENDPDGRAGFKIQS